MSEYQEFQDQLDALINNLGEASAMMAGFDGELTRVKSTLAATGQDVATLEKRLSSGLRRAFDGLVLDGKSLSDTLRTVAQSMIDTAYRAAVNPVMNSLAGTIASGVGNLIGNVMPFAKGGVISGATTFPMSGATGLMGEAGPEAIMPLTRGPDGSLGVRAAAGQSVNVVMKITTPDVEGFRRSQGQIAAQMGRVLSRGQRYR